MGNLIDICNLTKSYGRNRGVINLNLSVKEGEIYGFLGPNGAGKSTTIRSMLGLIQYKEGSIHVFGKDASTHSVEILKEVGYMPSEAMFYPSRRVSDIIRFAADSHKKDCQEEAGNICERLQVDGHKRIDELSLGNRKKVSIVCAMQHKPKLYIFDEPTSGLDPLMQKEFFKLLLERNQEGATCFLSSHVLSEVKKYCHRVAIIKEGKLICVDSVENLSATSTKRVRIKGISTLPELSGVTDMVVGQGEVDFVYNGEIKKLLNCLQALPLTDLIIEEPALDEVFLHFYEKGAC